MFSRGVGGSSFGSGVSEAFELERMDASREGKRERGKGAGAIY